MRFSVDPEVRRLDGGRLLLGGSPLRLFRMTEGGARLLDRVAAGADVEARPGEARLLNALIDAGVVNLRPERGPWSAAEVTLVVPVRDRPDGLAELLRSVAAARPSSRPAAVVVVDDGSADPVAHRSVALAAGAAYLRRERSGGPGVARDDGIRRAATDLVAVLDSDCTVAEDWLERLLPQFTDEQVAAVAARVRPEPGEGPLARYEAHRSPLDLGDRAGPVVAGTRLSYVPAAGVVLRRDAYVQVGGFDPSLRVGEDVDLVWRLGESGWRVRYEPAAEVHHRVRGSVRDWLAQRVAYGTSAALLEERHPGAVAPVRCSPWSAAAWGAVAAGHPVVGAAVVAGTTAALPQRLEQLPTRESIRLALLGHLGAGRLLARAVTRAWWPFLAVAAPWSRAARRALGLSAAAVVTDAWRTAGGSPDRVGLDPVRFGALTLADDLAYGVGVWVGCARRRSLRALRPRLTNWPSSQRSGA
ncbi:MAG: mycofactocin biosynthesis glycosyltransferase MftF [Microthrixaceae bacterium]